MKPRFPYDEAPSHCNSRRNFQYTQYGQQCPPRCLRCVYLNQVRGQSYGACECAEETAPCSCTDDFFTDDFSVDGTETNGYVTPEIESDRDSGANVLSEKSDRSERNQARNGSRRKKSYEGNEKNGGSTSGGSQRNGKNGEKNRNGNGRDKMPSNNRHTSKESSRTPGICIRNRCEALQQSSTYYDGQNSKRAKVTCAEVKYYSSNVCRNHMRPVCPNVHEYCLPNQMRHRQDKQDSYESSKNEQNFETANGNYSFNFSVKPGTGKIQNQSENGDDSGFTAHLVITAKPQAAKEPFSAHLTVSSIGKDGKPYFQEFNEKGMLGTNEQQPRLKGNEVSRIEQAPEKLPVDERPSDFTKSSVSGHISNPESKVNRLASDDRASSATRALDDRASQGTKSFSVSGISGGNKATSRTKITVKGASPTVERSSSIIRTAADDAAFKSSADDESSNLDESATDGKPLPTDENSSPRNERSSLTNGKSPPRNERSSLTNGKSPPTNGKSSPTNGKSSPTNGKSSSTDGNRSPTDGNRSPTDTDGPPIDGNRSPTDGNRSPTDGNRSPTDENISPTDGTRSPIDRDGSPTDGDQSPMTRGGSLTGRASLPRKENSRSSTIFLEPTKVSSINKSQAKDDKESTPDANQSTPSGAKSTKESDIPQEDQAGQTTPTKAPATPNQNTPRSRGQGIRRDRRDAMIDSSDSDIEPPIVSEQPELTRETSRTPASVLNNILDSVGRERKSNLSKIFEGAKRQPQEESQPANQAKTEATNKTLTEPSEITIKGRPLSTFRDLRSGSELNQTKKRRASAALLPRVIKQRLIPATRGVRGFVKTDIEPPTIPLTEIQTDFDRDESFNPTATSSKMFDKTDAYWETFKVNLPGPTSNKYPTTGRDKLEELIDLYEKKSKENQRKPSETSIPSPNSAGPSNQTSPRFSLLGKLQQTQRQRMQRQKELQMKKNAEKRHNEKRVEVKYAPFTNTANNIMLLQYDSDNNPINYVLETPALQFTTLPISKEGSCISTNPEIIQLDSSYYQNIRTPPSRSYKVPALSRLQQAVYGLPKNRARKPSEYPQNKTTVLLHPPPRQPTTRSPFR